MHYYQFNIGDYTSHTSHLEPLEDIAYRRMLDWYYLHESPLPESVEQIARLIRMRTHTESIANVLHDFFTLTEYGYTQSKADKEIETFKSKSKKAKASAEARWGAKPVKSDANALRTKCEGNANHKPLTNNHKPTKTLAAQVPYQDVLDLYHEHCTNLPTVKIFTDKRKQKLKTFWLKSEKHRELSFYKNYFAHVNQLDFLIGNIDDYGNRQKPWKADFEWLVNIDNLSKVIEGKYNNDK